jgi:hypothetical protein
MIDVGYPNLLRLFPEHLDNDRAESASFLIWYLEHYYRLDPTEAIDAVCDQAGDKGVDGIFVNDSDQTITIFQSRISQRANATIGDTGLKEFAGTLGQFETVEKISNLVTSAGAAAVATLIKSLDLVNKLGTHEVRGEFVTNIDLDRNGEAYLKTNSLITFVGKTALRTTYISDERNLPVRTPATFDILGFSPTEYIVDENRKAVIAPVKAIDLVKMAGIADQSLFAYNVRGPLGKTNVNKDIVASIKDKGKHKLFPLFHNGITVIAGKVELTKEKLTVDDYYVVNGCQSLTALFGNSEALTDDLRVLAKFIKLNPASSEAGMITTYSNNQNGVKSRDLKANSQIQIRLQNEMKRLYNKKYAFEIKRGEIAGEGTNISNEEAGLYLMAFDLHEPWSTHQKYSIFEDKHADLFGRPSVTADHIVMCRVIADTIDANLPKLEHRLFAKYALTRYMIMHMVRQILEKSRLAPELFTEPANFVRDDKVRAAFAKCIDTVVSDIVIDLNGEMEGDKSEYRSNLKSATWVRKITATVVADHQKLLVRKRIKSFEEEWNETRPTKK